MNTKDQRKTKAQLIEELGNFRRLAETEKVDSERKQVEAELREKSEFLDSVINSASEGIVVLDENANYRLINPASGRIMGHDPENWIGKPAGTNVHPDDQENVVLGFLKALSGESNRIETRVLGADGLYRTLYINCNPLTWAGKPHVIGVVTDITERKRAEEALRKTEESYRELADSITDIFFAMDRDLRYTYWNKASEELTGVKAEDALGNSIFEIFPDREDTRRAVATYREVLETQKPQNLVNEYTLNDRDYFFEISVYPTEEGLAVFTKDITERKRAEEALRKSESHYRLLAENVTDVVWTLDMNLRATYISPSVERLLGYTVEEAMPLTLEEALTPASFRTAMKIFEEEMAREKEKQKDLFRVRTLELEVICKDGTTIWTEVKASFLRSQNGQPIGTWGSGRDITERKQNEEKMKRLALYDHLTNLANRGLFYENLANALLRADRFQHFVFLLYLDLDGFKFVNDEFGHKAGDSVLIEVAERIQECVRKIDTAARLGGDEFGVILSDIKDKQYVKDVADRIIKSINRPININGDHCNIGASIGISIYPDSGQDADTLLHKADSAMYRVKKTSRNNYLFSNSS